MVERIPEKRLLSLSVSEAFFVYRGLEVIKRRLGDFHSANKIFQTNLYDRTKAFTDVHHEARLQGVFDEEHPADSLPIPDHLAKFALEGITICIEEVLQPRVRIALRDDLASQQRREADLLAAHTARQQLAELI